MPTMNDAFPSKYLSAEDLSGGDHQVRIASYSTEIMQARDGTQEQKYVLMFSNTKKGIVLNKTNGKAIAAQHGNDLDGWIGKVITIGPAWVESFGEQVLAIRVRPAMPGGPVAPTVNTAIDGDDGPRDDVPFNDDLPPL